MDLDSLWFSFHTSHCHKWTTIWSSWPEITFLLTRPVSVWGNILPKLRVAFGWVCSWCRVLGRAIELRCSLCLDAPVSYNLSVYTGMEGKTCLTSKPPLEVILSCNLILLMLKSPSDANTFFIIHYELTLPVYYTNPNTNGLIRL